MEVSKEEMTQTKIKLLKQMHQHVIDIGDEDLYYRWVAYAIPDEPDEEIYRFVAEHEEDWLDCCRIFHDIMVDAGELE